VRLRHIVTERQQLGICRGVCAHVVWKICELDTNACLLGGGSGNFVKAVYEANMLPSLELFTPVDTTSASLRAANSSALDSSSSLALQFLDLQKNIILQVARIAISAQSFRMQASQDTSITPGMFAHWQAQTAQLQDELLSSWAAMCPQAYIGYEQQDLPTVADLPDWVRLNFQNVSPTGPRTGANCDEVLTPAV
jgi:hypothetical protein